MTRPELIEGIRETLDTIAERHGVEKEELVLELEGLMAGLRWFGEKGIDLRMQRIGVGTWNVTMRSAPTARPGGKAKDFLKAGRFLQR